MLTCRSILEKPHIGIYDQDSDAVWVKEPEIKHTKENGCLAFFVYRQDGNPFYRSEIANVISDTTDNPVIVVGESLGIEVKESYIITQFRPKEGTKRKRGKTIEYFKGGRLSVSVPVHVKSLHDEVEVDLRPGSYDMIGVLGGNYENTALASS